MYVAPPPHSEILNTPLSVSDIFVTEQSYCKGFIFADYSACRMASETESERKL